MAKTITKNFSVDVVFKYDEYEDNYAATYKDIADTDLRVIEMRAEIQKGIDKACRLTKGTLNSQPGTVTET